MSLGLAWFYTTLNTYFKIKKMEIFEHQKMMTYSYAACFAAVRLRLYLLFLTMLFHDFITAYLIVAWRCCLPNIIVAYFLVKRLENFKDKTATNNRIAPSGADREQHHQL